MLVAVLVSGGLAAPPASAVGLPQTYSITPHVGTTAGNTLVTIRGQYLQNARRVYFGSTYVTAIDHVSTTLITVRSPAS